MAKFCGDCGKELAEDAKTCGTCGKAVPIASNILNQQTVDDAKKKFASATSMIREKSLKAAGQFREELKGINEARSKAAEEGKNGEEKEKLGQKNVFTKSFWEKLTLIQKCIVVGSLLLSLLLLSLFMISRISNHTESGNSSTSNGSNTSASAGSVSSLEPSGKQIIAALPASSQVEEEHEGNLPPEPTPTIVTQSSNTSGKSAATGEMQEKAWQRLRPNKGMMEVIPTYIAPKTLTSKGNLRRMWVLTDQEARGSQKELSVATLYEYNCAEPIRRSLKMVYFKGNMGTGESSVVMEKDDEYSWDSVLEGTGKSAVPAPDYRDACSLTAASKDTALASALPPVQSYVPEQRKLNCSAPGNSFDQLVCKSPKLNQLDGQLSALVYERARNSSSAGEIMAVQQEWLYGIHGYGPNQKSGREQSRCSTPECLMRIYQERIEELTSPSSK